MKLSLNSFFHAVRYALDVTNYTSIFLRVKQCKILEACILRRHVISVLPTGYGKSVIFHLLPYMWDFINEMGDKSIVIVVSPLNALIEDQVTSLKVRGIKAGVLRASCQQGSFDYAYDSDIGSAESDDESEVSREKKYSISETDVFHRVQKGECKLLFTHPEAFISCKDGRKVLQSNIYQNRVVFCVIDEAHLIKEWGSKFRPDFGKLAQLGSQFPTAPILALTATAPQKLIEHLKVKLQLKNPTVLVGNLDRANIFFYKFKRRPSTFGSESYDDILLPIAEELKVKLTDYPLTLIYLPLKWCGYAFKLFRSVLGEQSHVPAISKDPENCLFAQYHAPQTDLMKDEILKQLTGLPENCKIRVVFATVAIGIGVNIPEVRHVIHLDVPRTLESYFQEIGRAGRDNKPARATLYYNGNDIAANKPGMTDEMRKYCKLEYSCMREFVLRYLGSTSNNTTTPSQLCCSNCLVREEHHKEVTSGPKQSQVKSAEPEKAAVRSISEEQRKKIRDLLLKYRLHLGAGRRRFGDIDSSTGFTVKLINSVLPRCEFLSSTEEILSSFQIWERTHAEVVMEIIKSVCEES